MRIDFLLTWKRALALMLAAAALALVVGYSGMVSIAASSGHFAPVGWFLHWTMQNAVNHQSILIEVPEDVDLSDPALVQRAAGHFATECATCHGAPGVPQSPVVLSMTPAPPRLEEKIAEWRDRELFWIGKHGIKYSGMPAWPTQTRDDEVWAQVAFLRALPEMSAERYADLALGGELGRQPLEAGSEAGARPDDIFEVALTDCARCHGRDGLGRGSGDSQGAFPVIAGQPASYLLATLKAYAAGERHSGFMQPPAKRYDEETLSRLADWYASQTRPGDDQSNEETIATTGSEPGEGPEDGIPPQIFPADTRSSNAVASSAEAAALPANRDAVMKLGEQIATKGIAARKIPACESCHGKKGRTKNPLYPSLAGQPHWYAETHLHLWKEDHRGGTAASHLMAPIAINMSDEQIESVAVWYEEQG